jgi:hypothetical protein
MTITLDYSDLHFEEDRAVMLAEETDFEYDLLSVEIVFLVDGADFSITHEHVTLLDFSASLRWLVDSLTDAESTEYKSPTAWAQIIFVRSGDQVAISTNYTKATASVRLSDLQQAVRDFHERVLHDLLARYPGLDETPGARPYFAPDPAWGG